MTIINSPAYIDIDGQQYEYEPKTTLCSLRRYNIAQCARQRMIGAFHEQDDFVEKWKGERASFWSTLARAIPDTFK